MPQWRGDVGAVLALLILVAYRDDSADPAPTPAPPDTADSQSTASSDAHATVVDVILCQTLVSAGSDWGGSGQTRAVQDHQCGHLSHLYHGCIQQ